MTELVGYVASWQALAAYGTALLVFGFAPGFALRLIVKLYPKDDLRRDELVAELYAMPRVWRPMWVVQQIETGLFEGLGARRAARELRRSIVKSDWLPELIVVGDQEARRYLQASGQNRRALRAMHVNLLRSGANVMFDVAHLDENQLSEFARIVLTPERRFRAFPRGE